MESKKYKIVLEKVTVFVDHSKQGSDRYNAKMNPGEYTVKIIKNPSGVKSDSNWLLFEGTSIGATIEYFKTVVTTFNALS